MASNSNETQSQQTPQEATHLLFDTRNCFCCEKCVRSKSTKGSQPLFLKAVTVWVKKPHVVNKRICGAKLVSLQRFDTEMEVNDYLREAAIVFSTNNFKTQPFEFEDLSTETMSYTVIIRQLIPKLEFFPKVYEAVILDRNKKTVHFIPISDGEYGESSNCSTIEISYSVRFVCRGVEDCKEKSYEIVLSWACDHESEVSKRQLSSKWLSSVLLEKLVNWSQITDISTSITSLQLVHVDEYQKTYSRLKNMYGRDLVKNWTESTDPQKFVYEDIAIATYLLLIWEEDRVVKNLDRKQTFVDLGCGNGLLVYILTKEGHKGLGIDLRKRKIWDTFGPDTDLQEMTITPSGDNLFPNYDWIIGNHSDELTPWIPVISARSSYTSCFFVLPCCHFDFVGKYSITEKGKSKYASYLTFVKEVIANCGFNPECDTLRIPSTKRISYIGRYRTYPKDQEDKADKERQHFIDTFCKSRQSEGVGSLSRNVVSEANKSGDGLTLSSSISNHQDQNLSKAKQLLAESPTCSENSPEKSKCRVNDSDSGLIKHSSNVLDCGTQSSTEEGELHSPCSKKARKESDSNSNCTDVTATDMEIPGTCKNSSESAKNICEMDMTVVDEKGVREMNDVARLPASQWVSDFQPRLETKARNCQSVAAETKLKIVDAVFNLVLAADPDNVVLLDSNEKWCKGGVVPLSQVASLFDKSTLQELKSECGGLQTLLRNHSHIFQVTGGNVRLRDFTATDPWEGRNPQKAKAKQGKTLKTTECWFYSHHPNGCPKGNADCLFAHGKEDLKVKS